jgi:transketolase
MNTILLSKLGQRGVFGRTICDLAENHDNLYTISADLNHVSGLDRFLNKYPDRCLNVGIAEQNMIGVAAGLSEDNENIVFATSFSNFAVLRGCEQLRHFLGYMQANVKLVGLSAGFALGMFGTTHYGVEDIAITRSIPNLTILSPADGLETEYAVTAAANMVGPVYIRLTGAYNNPVIYEKEYEFKIGKAITLKQGSDIAIIATGSMVNTALIVAAELNQLGITSTVVNMHTIKPLDYDLLDNIVHDYKLVVSIEEHSKIGGLDSAISEYTASIKKHSTHLILGTEDVYYSAGDYHYMLCAHGLSVEKIKQKIIDTYDFI